MEMLALNALGIAHHERRISISGQRGYEGRWLYPWLDALGFAGSQKHHPNQATRAHHR